MRCTHPCAISSRPPPIPPHPPPQPCLRHRRHPRPRTRHRRQHRHLLHRQRRHAPPTPLRRSGPPRPDLARPARQKLPRHRPLLRLPRQLSRLESANHLLRLHVDLRLPRPHLRRHRPSRTHPSLAVPPDFFTVLRAQPLLGRTFTRDDDHPNPSIDPPQLQPLARSFRLRPWHRRPRHHRRLAELQRRRRHARKIPHARLRQSLGSPRLDGRRPRRPRQPQLQRHRAPQAANHNRPGQIRSRRHLHAPRTAISRRRQRLGCHRRFRCTNN